MVFEAFRCTNASSRSFEAWCFGVLAVSPAVVGPALLRTQYVRMHVCMQTRLQVCISAPLIRLWLRAYGLGVHCRGTCNKILDHAIKLSLSNPFKGTLDPLGTGSPESPNS